MPVCLTPGLQINPIRTVLSVWHKGGEMPAALSSYCAWSHLYWLESCFYVIPMSVCRKHDSIYSGRDQESCGNSQEWSMHAQEAGSSPWVGNKGALLTGNNNKKGLRTIRSMRKHQLPWCLQLGQKNRVKRSRIWEDLLIKTHIWGISSSQNRASIPHFCIHCFPRCTQPLHMNFNNYNREQQQNMERETPLIDKSRENRA